MKIEQIYTGCLAQGAYYIVSGKEAAIIDPLREIQPYIDRAKRDGVTIKYIFETHFHADFVSGHLDLSKKTGAEVVFGPSAQPEYEALIAVDNQEFKLGDITIKALHTPGHTLESTVYLLKDEQKRDYAIFTGDTLFLGDVGRPDLAQTTSHLSKEQLAGLLYDSLNSKIMPLADDVIVYPAHGAGSACGKNMSKETVDTLGHQKQTNYALKQPNKEAFIKAVTEDLLPPPAYFPGNVAMNKKGYADFEAVLNKGMTALSPDELEQEAELNAALILDTRPAAEFCKGFVPQSINIGLNGDFAPWVGTLVATVSQPLLLVTENGKEEETVTRLSRVGFDHVLGHLKGGFEAWKSANKEIDHIQRISAEAFAEEMEKEPAKVVDVRKESEYDVAHVQNAENMPLASINDWIKEIHPKRSFFLHCAGGYRSMIAASILKSRGYHNFKEVEGGFVGIQKTPIAISLNEERVR